jgi:predicted dehydrogenase
MGEAKKLRVGIVGVGAIAQACHLPGYAKNENVELIAFADPEQARHKEMAKSYDYMTGYAHYLHMFKKEKLDVVSVCAPNKFHAEATIAALEAKCHVLCERPIATTIKEADAMIAAAQKAKRKLMVGFTHRLFNGSLKAKEFLDQKILGKPFMIRVRFAHGGPYPALSKSDWFYHKDLSGGGALLDMGIHAIDLCLWMFGPAIAVTARTATLLKKIDVEDNAVVMFEFKNGAMGYLEAGWTSKPGFTGFEIYGTEGSIICDYNRGLFLCGGKPPVGAEGGTDWKAIDRSPTQGGWATEIGYWIDVLRGEQKLTMDGKAGRNALEAALAAYKSSASGKRVAIE